MLRNFTDCVTILPFWFPACLGTSCIVQQRVPSTSKLSNKGCMPSNNGPRIKLGYGRRNAERIRIFLQDLEATTTPIEEPRSSEASSSFPIPGKSHADLIEEVIMAEEPRRVTLENYSSSSVPQFFTSIAQPEFQAQTITYPPSLIQRIQNNLFHGLPNEDPYAHLASYIEIWNTIRLAGVPEDAIWLSLFSFSLSGEAKRWLHSFKCDSLKTWDEVVEKFQKKYFPESKTA